MACDEHRNSTPTEPRARTRGAHDNRSDIETRSLSNESLIACEWSVAFAMRIESDNCRWTDCCNVRGQVQRLAPVVRTIRSGRIIAFLGQLLAAEAGRSAATMPCLENTDTYVRIVSGVAVHPAADSVGRRWADTSNAQAGNQARHQSDTQDRHDRHHSTLP